MLNSWTCISCMWIDYNVRTARMHTPAFTHTSVIDLSVVYILARRTAAVCRNRKKFLTSQILQILVNNVGIYTSNFEPGFAMLSVTLVLPQRESGKININSLKLMAKDTAVYYSSPLYRSIRHGSEYFTVRFFSNILRWELNPTPPNGSPYALSARPWRHSKKTG